MVRPLLMIQMNKTGRQNHVMIWRGHVDVPAFYCFARLCKRRRMDAREQLGQQAFLVSGVTDNKY